MSVRLLLTAGLAMLLLGGCRYDPHMQLYVDNVNAEKRLLEDTLYDLQYDYECKIQEVDKLRGELTQLKSGETTGGTSRAGAGSGRKTRDTIRARRQPVPGHSRVETADRGTGHAGAGEDSEASEDAGQRRRRKSPRKIEDMDDLEPPTLDLGEKKSDVSAAPKPINQQAGAPEQARDTTSKKPSKLASRWTPRAERPQEPPVRRINVAESPGEQRTDSDASASGGSADQASSSAAQFVRCGYRPAPAPWSLRCAGLGRLVTTHCTPALQSLSFRWTPHVEYTEPALSKSSRPTFPAVHSARPSLTLTEQSPCCAATGRM